MNPTRSALSPEALRAALVGARLYGILDLGYADATRLVEIARRLIADGEGVQMLQLRAKDHPPEQIARWAESLLPLARAAGVPLVVNDHVEVAAEVGADGVHLGQDDGPLDAARGRLRPGALVGRSTHSLEQALQAAVEGADYIGFGPLHATPTKPGRPAIGLDGIAEVQRRVDLPVFCIGGLTSGQLPDLRRRGLQRAVIVSALLQAPDIAAEARRARAALELIPKEREHDPEMENGG